MENQTTSETSAMKSEGQIFLEKLTALLGTAPEGVRFFVMASQKEKERDDIPGLCGVKGTLREYSNLIANALKHDPRLIMPTKMALDITSAPNSSTAQVFAGCFSVSELVDLLKK